MNQNLKNQIRYILLGFIFLITAIISLLGYCVFIQTEFGLFTVMIIILIALCWGIGRLFTWLGIQWQNDFNPRNPQ